ncbi:MAG: hypothetical protein KF833_12830 [Verrucomicrobiae bacterium]|nr:hypothetical protein [Verrucomicrobiae bacterium]
MSSFRRAQRLALRWRRIALILLALAAVLSGWLGVQSVTRSAIPGCETAGCGDVLNSRWSMVFGVPVAFWGAVAYAALALFAGRALSHPQAGRARFLARVLAGLVPGAAAWFIALQIFHLNAFCPWCCAIHVLACLGTLCLLPARRQPAPRSSPTPFRAAVRSRAPAFALACVLLGGLAGIQALGPAPTPPQARSAVRVVSTSASTAPDTLLLQGGRFAFDPSALPRTGHSEASHQVVVISDYTCSHCRRASLLLHETRSQAALDGVAYVHLPAASTPNARAIHHLLLAAWHLDPAVWNVTSLDLQLERLPAQASAVRAALVARLGHERLDAILTRHQADFDQLLESTRQVRASHRELTGSGGIPQFVLGNQVIVGAPADTAEVLRWFEDHLGLAAASTPPANLVPTPLPAPDPAPVRPPGPAGLPPLPTSAFASVASIHSAAQLSTAASTAASAAPEARVLTEPPPASRRALRPAGPTSATSANASDAGSGSGSGSGSGLAVHDAILAPYAPAIPSLIPSVEAGSTRFTRIGTARAGGPPVGKVFQLVNQGSAPLRLDSITLAAQSLNPRLALHELDGPPRQTTPELARRAPPGPIPWQLPGRTLQPGASLHVLVSLTPPSLDELRRASHAIYRSHVPTDAPEPSNPAAQLARIETGLHASRLIQLYGALQRAALEIASDDPETPLYRLNLLGAFAPERPLACSADNNNWVPQGFSCANQPNGTLCGSPDEDGRHSRICNQGECVLMGDLNGDGRLSLDDIAAYLGDLDGDGHRDDTDAPRQPARPRNAWLRSGDFTCDGAFTGTPHLNGLNLLATLIAEYSDAEAYNSRVIEWCTGRDLILEQARQRLDPGAVNRHPNHGLGYAFRNGYIDFDAMKAATGPITATSPLIYKTPDLVCLDSIGKFDPETGAELPLSSTWELDERGLLSGRYLSTSVVSNFTNSLGIPPLFRMYSNDFRVHFLGEDYQEKLDQGLVPPLYLPPGLKLESTTPRREALLWASQVQMYYDITRYRNVFFNTHFAKALKLPAEAEKNVLFRQFRPDLVGLTRFAKPEIIMEETFAAASLLKPGVVLIEPQENRIYPSVRVRTSEGGFDLDDVYGIAFDTSAVAADYAGLMAYWIIRDKRGFPGETSTWATNEWKVNVLPAVNDGLSTWEAYRLTSSEQVLDSSSYIVSRWYNASGCKDGTISCRHALTINNPMIFQELTNNSTFFPFFDHAFEGSARRFNSLGGGDIASFFFAAVLRDLSQDLGLGDWYSSLIFWKVLDYIADQSSYSMADFLKHLTQAVRTLLPEGTEDRVRVALASRGLLSEGIDKIALSMPFATRDSSGQEMASTHPAIQTQELGSEGFQIGTYVGESDARFYAFHFLNHSRLGPCDSLEITNGSFQTNGSYLPLTEGQPFRKIFVGREMANITLLAPGHHFSWKLSTKRCPTNLDADYRMDVSVFGFRVTSAIKDGFGVEIRPVVEDQYVLSPVDPFGMRHFKIQSREMGATEFVDKGVVSLGTSREFSRNVYLIRLSEEEDGLLIPPFSIATDSLPRTIDCVSLLCDD